MSVQSEEALNQGVVFLIHLSWLVSFYELNSICSEWPRTATMYHHINVAQIIHTTYSINTIEAVTANTQNSRKTHTNTKQVKLPHEELLSNAMKHRTDRSAAEKAQDKLPVTLQKPSKSSLLHYY